MPVPVSVAGSQELLFSLLSLPRALLAAWAGKRSTNVQDVWEHWPYTSPWTKNFLCFTPLCDFGISAKQSGLSNLPAHSCSLTAGGNVDLQVVQAAATTFTSVESRG